MAREYLNETGLASLWAKIVNKINALGDQIHAEMNASVQTLTMMIATKIDKTGDTMTGDLLFNNSNSRVRDTDIDIDTTPSSSIWGNGYYIEDSDKNDIAYMRAVQDTSNNIGLQIEVYRKVNNANYYNTLRLGITNTGDKTIGVSDPADWRSALGLAAVASSGSYADLSNKPTIPTGFNFLNLGESNHASSTGAGLSSDTGQVGAHWYSATGKIPNQPSQYGFLFTLATSKGGGEQHSMWFEQANGNLYHMGTNNSSSGSPPAFKKLWDSGNAAIDKRTVTTGTFRGASYRIVEYYNFYFFAFGGDAASTTSGYENVVQLSKGDTAINIGAPLGGWSNPAQNGQIQWNSGYVKAMFQTTGYKGGYIIVPKSTLG